RRAARPAARRRLLDPRFADERTEETRSSRCSPRCPVQQAITALAHCVLPPGRIRRPGRMLQININPVQWAGFLLRGGGLRVAKSLWRGRAAIPDRLATPGRLGPL